MGTSIRRGNQRAKRKNGQKMLDYAFETNMRMAEDAIRTGNYKKIRNTRYIRRDKKIARANRRLRVTVSST